MKQVGLLGNLDIDKTPCSGQVIKTKIIVSELQKHFGNEMVMTYDTSKHFLFIIQLPFLLISLLRHCRHIIIMPAYKGVLIITPLLVLLNLLFQRKLHYVVIGGWLPDYLEKYPILRHCLRKIDRIYVETHSMLQSLYVKGYRKTFLMPNCKPIIIQDQRDFDQQPSEPYRLCTLSRVVKEKGIEEAVHAVQECNHQLGKTAFTLDIYGHIFDTIWFENLMKSCPDYITYKGIVNYQDTTATIMQYQLLLFPTYHIGEGFPGTLLDALAAGTPSIVSNWHDNATIIRDGETGFVVKAKSVHALKDALIKVYEDYSVLIPMRQECIKQAHRYLPENVLQTLIEELS